MSARPAPVYGADQNRGTPAVLTTITATHSTRGPLRGQGDIRRGLTRQTLRSRKKGQHEAHGHASDRGHPVVQHPDNPFMVAETLPADGQLATHRGESTMNDDWATHEVRAAQPGGEQSTLDRLWQGWAAELLRGEHTRTVQIVQKAETLLDNPTEPERYAQFRAGYRQACHDILAELQRERHGRQSTPR